MRLGGDWGLKGTAVAGAPSVITPDYRKVQSLCSRSLETGSQGEPAPHCRLPRN